MKQYIYIYNINIEKQILDIFCMKDNIVKIWTIIYIHVHKTKIVNNFTEPGVLPHSCGIQ